MKVTFSLRRLNFFSACFCKNIDHPNVADINSFIVWLVGKFSYASSTKKNCIGVIKMFYREKGYEMTDFAKAKLKQAYKKIKKCHTNKTQGTGKDPITFEDIEFMIKKMPSQAVYKRKYFKCSLVVVVCCQAHYYSRFD